MRYFVFGKVLQPIQRFWNWSATWKWYDLLLIGGFGLSIALQEYAIAIICLSLCTVSCVSTVAHFTSLSGIKIAFAYIGIVVALAFFVYVTVQEKGTQEWSHLSSPVRGLYGYFHSTELPTGRASLARPLSESEISRQVGIPRTSPSLKAPQSYARMADLPNRILSNILEDKAMELDRTWSFWWADDGNISANIRYLMDDEEKNKEEIKQLTEKKEKLKSTITSEVREMFRDIDPYRAEAVKRLGGGDQSDNEEAVIFKAFIAGNIKKLDVNYEVRHSNYLKSLVNKLRKE